jgi:hypothetical protein
MSHWDRKRVGLLYEAVSIYVATTGDDATRSQLAPLMHRAKEASTRGDTSAFALGEIHSELCAYCTSKGLFNCGGHHYQRECLFMESAFGVRTSQFGGLS